MIVDTMAFDAKSVRSIDSNGFMHIKYSPFTKEQVAPYYGREIPGWEAAGLQADKTYYGYRSAEELSKPETVESLNGIPVQFRHHPDFADLAGQRKGFKDNYKGTCRGTLFMDVARICEYHKPKVIFCENVKGLVIHDRGRTFQIICDTFKDLGYTVFSKTLNSKNFGVPQNRERLIVIGNRLGINSKTVIDNIKKASTSYPNFTLFDAISDLPELKPNRVKNNTKLENKDIGFAKIEFNYSETNFLKFINSKKCNYLYNHKNRYNNDRDIEIFSRLPQGANSLHPSIADIMPYSSRNDIFKDKYFKLRYNDVCKTITSHMKFDCNMYIHPWEARGLSPREAARIQTFPDDYVIRGAQNQWYAQIGNAVPVKLAEAIGRSILEFLK